MISKIHQRYVKMIRNAVCRNVCVSIIALLLGSCLSTGCFRNKPTKYFVLRPITELEERDEQKEGGERNVVVGLSPLELPIYLDRNELVLERSTHELLLTSLNEWAEPLKESIPRVLRDNIEYLLPNIDMQQLPQAEVENVRYRVAVTIHKFEAQTSSKVGAPQQSVLDASWRVYKGNTAEELAADRRMYTTQIVDKAGTDCSAGYGANRPRGDTATQSDVGCDFRAIVASLNQGVSDLARDLSLTLKDVVDKQAAAEAELARLRESKKRKMQKVSVSVDGGPAVVVDRETTKGAPATIGRTVGKTVGKTSGVDKQNTEPARSEPSGSEPGTMSDIQPTTVPSSPAIFRDLFGRSSKDK